MSERARGTTPVISKNPHVAHDKPNEANGVNNIPCVRELNLQVMRVAGNHERTVLAGRLSSQVLAKYIKHTIPV
jgi:hypothetical protein